MVENQSPDDNASAIQAHLTIMQSIIQRMAENSRSCKIWCVTLVAATLVLVARTGEPQHALIALVPTLLFLVLDTYYLALERAFRKSYNAFVIDLHANELPPSRVYKVDPIGMGLPLVVRCLGSVSIWLFYPLVAATVILAWQLVIPSETLATRV